VGQKNQYQGRTLARFFVSSILIARNPQTGSEIQISAAKAPRFKAGKALKEAVNG